MDVVCGLDIGTSGAKAIAVTREGEVVARAERAFEHAPYQPQPGRAEQDAGEWWRAGATCLRDLTAQLTDHTLRAVCVDSTSGTVVPVDRDLCPLMPAMMYNDGRARGLEAQVNRAGAGLTKRLGYGFSSTFALVKLFWLQQHHPEIVEQTDAFLHAADFVVAHLIDARPATDTSNALKSGVDLITGTWPNFIETDLGLPLAKFPPVVRPGEQVGEVSPAAAVDTGLSVGLPVVAGATDGTVSFLASGAKHAGDWNVTIGTTIAIRGIAPEIIRDPLGRLYCHRHPEGFWLPGGASNVGGEALLRVFGADALDSLDQQASDNIPSPMIVYPLVRKGERLPFASSKAEGFVVGDDAPNAARDAVRFAGYLEGIALVAAWSVAEAGTLGAAVDGAFYLTGGAARGQTLGKLVASALARPLTVTRESESAFGSALLAAGWAWYAGSVSQAQTAMVQAARMIDPVPAWIDPMQTKQKELINQCRQRKYL